MRIVAAMTTALVCLVGGPVGAVPQDARAASPDTMSLDARAYLTEALDLMREHSLHRDRVDWPAVRRAAEERARGAREPSDTYDAIRHALTLLGDRHSFLITDDTGLGREAARGGGVPARPGGELLKDRYAYVSIPLVGANAYADSILGILADLDAAEPCGWIVDLRHNLGGNMWPMLLGLEPLLGSGHVGTFVAPDGERSRWLLEGGSVAIDSTSILSSDRFFVLGSPNPPVAVLTGPRTVSSGEAVAVAFRGRPGTRFFGRATAGLSTANYPFPLSDGARLNLTVSVFADRSGTVYGGPIEPDVTVGGPTDFVLIETAIEWLGTFGGARCRP